MSTLPPPPVPSNTEALMVLSVSSTVPLGVVVILIDPPLASLASVVTVLLFSCRATAQGSGIVGTLFDLQGSVIPGITIMVSTGKNKTVSTIRSDDNGEFAVRLPVGTYSLEVGNEFSLFCKVVIKNYRVVANREPMRLDIVLGESMSSHGGDRCRKKVIKF